MNELTVLSLFDGIATGRYCLEQAGIKVKTYYASEIDKDAIDIALYNHPDIIELGDVTKIDFKQFEGKIDLIIGGSPCQSLSITTSKKRTNLDGSSKLFFEFVRAIKEVKPKYFFLENVASMSKESKYIMSQYMGCNPQFIDSSVFSAQERKRLYWFNWGDLHKDLVGNKSYTVPMPAEREPIVLKDIMEESPDEKYYYSQTFDFHGLDKSVCATLHINGHDIIKRVHSPFSKCHSLTCCRGGNHQKKVYDIEKDKCRKLTPLEYERLQGLPDNYTKYGVTKEISDSQRYNCTGNGWEANTVTHIFSYLKEEYQKIESIEKEDNSDKD